MRPVDYSLVTADKGLALITVPDLDEEGSVYLADFKDTHALAFQEWFLGLGADGMVRLGGHPIRMTDGVWYITEDEAKSREQDIVVTREDLRLAPIK